MKQQYDFRLQYLHALGVQMVAFWAFPQTKERASQKLEESSSIIIALANPTEDSRTVVLSVGC